MHYPTPVQILSESRTNPHHPYLRYGLREAVIALQEIAEEALTIGNTKIIAELERVGVLVMTSETWEIR